VCPKYPSSLKSKVTTLSIASGGRRVIENKPSRKNNVPDVNRKENSVDEKGGSVTGADYWEYSVRLKRRRMVGGGACQGEGSG